MDCVVRPRSRDCRWPTALVSVASEPIRPLRGRRMADRGTRLSQQARFGTSRPKVYNTGLLARLLQKFVRLSTPPNAALQMVASQTNTCPRRSPTGGAHNNALKCVLPAATNGWGSLSGLTSWRASTRYEATPGPTGWRCGKCGCALKLLTGRL